MSNIPSQFKKEEEWLLREKYHGEKTPGFFKDIDRLKNGEPLAYIIGTIPFLDVTIDLTSKPLIPRPETEYWTEKAIAEIANSNMPAPTILDVFAGSGCIGAAILARIPTAHIDFAEHEPKHIPQIKKNLDLNDLPTTHAHIHESDVFSGIPKERTYNYIFANPPYVSKDPEDTAVEESVKKFEPQDAVFAEDHGLFYIKKLIRESSQHLTANGVLFIEFDPWQKAHITQYAEKEGADITYWEDQYHRPRTARCTYRKKS